MKHSYSVIGLALLGLFLLSPPARAHVPYFEHRDFTEDAPFEIPYTIEQSIAAYAWLETDGIHPSEDVDVYAFDYPPNGMAPVRVYVELLVPVCPSYETFVPWFALVGPGLPPPAQALPFTVPEGCGVRVFENTGPGEPRESFYEPFGDKSYYKGPIFDEILPGAGRYFLYFWDPYEQGGDYVAVIGGKEIWRPRDIVRALVFTPQIRKDQELHVDCGD